MSPENANAKILTTPRWIPALGCAVVKTPIMRKWALTASAIALIPMPIWILLVFVNAKTNGQQLM
jgi:hypothetical protein